MYMYMYYLIYTLVLLKISHRYLFCQWKVCQEANKVEMIGKYA